MCRGGGVDSPRHPLQGGIHLPVDGDWESGPVAQLSPLSCCTPHLFGSGLGWAEHGLSGPSSLPEMVEASLLGRGSELAIGERGKGRRRRMILGSFSQVLGKSEGTGWD